MVARRPKILETWDEIQHDPLTTPPDNFEGLSQEEAVEVIKDWFLHNFEDPAHHTPYESAEGGYQYIWGGPYNARDIIENVFADSASEELIAAAVEEMERESWEWVPSDGRRQPPEEDEDYDPPDVVALHAEMQNRITAIEEALARLAPEAAGVGHNNPPEPIEDTPLEEPERSALVQALGVLKAQPVEPTDNGEAAAAAVSFLRNVAEKARSWLARQGDAFVSEAIKEGGKEFGKWGTRVLWVYVLSELISLSDIAVKWLDAIRLPF